MNMKDTLLIDAMCTMVEMGELQIDALKEDYRTLVSPRVFGFLFESNAVTDEERLEESHIINLENSIRIHRETYSNFYEMRLLLLSIANKDNFDGVEDYDSVYAFIQRMNISTVHPNIIETDINHDHLNTLPLFVKQMDHINRLYDFRRLNDTLIDIWAMTGYSITSGVAYIIIDRLYNRTTK